MSVCVKHIWVRNNIMFCLKQPSINLKQHFVIFKTTLCYAQATFHYSQIT